jgi:hypothetical protein
MVYLNNAIRRTWTRFLYCLVSFLFIVTSLTCKFMSCSFNESKIQPSLMLSKWGNADLDIFSTSCRYLCSYEISRNFLNIILAAGQWVETNRFYNDDKIWIRESVPSVLSDKGNIIFLTFTRLFGRSE